MGAPLKLKWNVVDDRTGNYMGSDKALHFSFCVFFMCKLSNKKMDPEILMIRDQTKKLNVNPELLKVAVDMPKMESTKQKLNGSKSPGRARGARWDDFSCQFRPSSVATLYTLLGARHVPLPARIRASESIVLTMKLLISRPGN